MRRRSGGIHSESEEQFIKLAEQAFEITGIFYDDKFNKTTPEDKYLSRQNTTSESVFDSFNYKPLDQLERDQKNLDEQMCKQMNMNISNVIICDETNKISSMMTPEIQQTQNEIVESRGLDLIVRKQIDATGKIYVFKYWLIQYDMYTSALAQIYISAAKKIYWTSQKVTPLDVKIIQCQISELNQKIEADQQLLQQN